MNSSSYGLVILIQRVVEPIHFMDLIIFWSSSWMNLSSYGLDFNLWLNPTTFGMSPSTLGSTSNHPLGDESIYYVDYKQLEIIPYGMSPSIMCTYIFQITPLGWICPFRTFNEYVYK